MDSCLRQLLLGRLDADFRTLDEMERGRVHRGWKFGDDHLEAVTTDWPRFLAAYHAGPHFVRKTV